MHRNLTSCQHGQKCLGPNLLEAISGKLSQKHTKRQHSKEEILTAHSSNVYRNKNICIKKRD